VWLVKAVDIAPVAGASDEWNSLYVEPTAFIAESGDTVAQQDVGEVSRH